MDSRNTVIQEIPHLLRGPVGAGTLHLLIRIRPGKGTQETRGETGPGGQFGHSSHVASSGNRHNPRDNRNLYTGYGASIGEVVEVAIVEE